MNRSSNQRGFITFGVAVFTLTSVMLSTVITTQRVVADTSPSASPSGAIAYIYDNYDNDKGTTDFHVIQPDGSNDHIIATLPISHMLFTPELAWRPDGAELAFTSNHENTQSFWDSDVYAMRPDGTDMRRITNGPAVSAFASYPKGSVTVDVVMNGGLYVVYVEGAPEAQVVATSRRLTFNDVAIFPGKFQRVVAMGSKRWFSPTTGAVLQTGQTVHAGTLQISGLGVEHRRLLHLSWRSDGSALAFRPSIGYDPGGAYYKVASNPPELDTGTVLLSSSPRSTLRYLFDYAPVPSKADQFLYAAAENYLQSPRAIWLGTEDGGAGEPLVSAEYQYQLFHHVKWLPDGSGFLYALAGIGNFAAVVNSNIYEYDFATRTSRQITNFADQFAYAFDVSPDGQQIVFEYSADGALIDGLWMVNRDGSNPRAFVKGGARPAWSRVTPQVPQPTPTPTPPPSTDKKVHLPVVRRGG